MWRSTCLPPWRKAEHSKLFWPLPVCRDLRAECRARIIFVHMFSLPFAAYDAVRVRQSHLLCILAVQSHGLIEPFELAKTAFLMDRCCSQTYVGAGSVMLEILGITPMWGNLVLPIIVVVSFEPLLMAFPVHRGGSFWSGRLYVS